MARKFNGTTDRVEVDDAVTTPVWWNDLFGRSYAGWVNAPAGQSNVFFYGEGQSSSNVSFWGLGIIQATPATNLLRWSGSSTPGLSSAAVVADSTWHHVALVVDNTGNPPASGNSAFLYVDGHLEASTLHFGSTNTGGGAKNRAAFGCLPRIAAGNFLNGLLAHWGIWNRTLSPDEVRLLARGVLPSEFSPQHYFPLTGPDVVAAKDIGHRRNSGTLVGTTVSANVPPLARQPRPVKWAERYAGAKFFRLSSVTLAGTSSLTATVRELHRFSVALAGRSSLSASLAAERRFTATLAGTSSLTASVRDLRRFTAALAGTSSLTATTTTFHRLAATLAGTSSLSAAISRYQRITATLAGRSSLAATVTTGGALDLIVATLAGTSSLTATLSRYQRITVAFAGRGSLSAQFVIQAESGVLELLGDDAQVYPAISSSGVVGLESDGATILTFAAVSSGVLHLASDPATVGPLPNPTPGVLLLAADSPLMAGPLAASSGALLLQAGAATVWTVAALPGVLRLKADAATSLLSSAASGVLKLRADPPTVLGPAKPPSAVLRLLADDAEVGYSLFLPRSGILLLKAADPIVTPLTPPPPPPPPPVAAGIHIDVRF